jgi:hypothetical protein
VRRRGGAGGRPVVVFVVMVGGSQRVPTNAEHTGIIINIPSTVLIIVIAIPLCR